MLNLESGDWNSEKNLRYTPEIRYKNGIVFAKLNIAEHDVEFMGTHDNEIPYIAQPTVISDISNLKSLPRRIMSERYKHLSVLENMWLFQSENFPPIIGTPDHNQLLYFLYQSTIVETSPNDVLLNFDSHDDVSQGDKLVTDVVTIANFVGFGITDLQETKVWDQYLLVCPEGTHGTGMMRHLKKNSQRFSSLEYADALEKALELARLKKSKIILSIDLDFFGSRDLKKSDEITENSRKQIIKYLFDFAMKHHDDIRLVSFTESLSYCSGENSQVEQLYNLIVEEFNRNKKASESITRRPII